MSDDPSPFNDATRVPSWTRPSVRSFAPRAVGDPVGFSRWTDAPTDTPAAAAPVEEPALDAEALIAHGYAEGLAEGQRQSAAEVEEERAALVRLADTLQALNPAGGDGLAAVLSATVYRLVSQIVGEVEINADTLAERCRAVAATISEDTQPSRMRLHPTDVARLDGASFGIEMVADPLLAPGTVVLDTGAGWVEDGPHVRLERLRAALDKLGATK